MKLYIHSTLITDVPCDVLPFIENGGHDSELQPGEMAPEGTILQYKCDGGYSLEGSENITCMEGGEWSSEQPSCVCEFADYPFLAPHSRPSQSAFADLYSI